MEIVMAFAIGLLFMCAIYLMLSRKLIRIVIGTGLLTHAVNLLLMVMGGFANDKPPVLTEGGGRYADPLPQALILTAIVISFGVTALTLVLAYRAYQDVGTDDSEQMKGASADESE